MNKYQAITFDGCLGKCEYFTAQKYDIKGEGDFLVGKESFQCVTCTKGCGFIDNVEIKQGDSFFVPANYGRYQLKGSLEVIITKV